jgi:hypothetical protein
MSIEIPQVLEDVKLKEPRSEYLKDDFWVSNGMRMKFVIDFQLL